MIYTLPTIFPAVFQAFVLMQPLAIAAPRAATQPARAPELPLLSMVMIDDQLRARPIALQRLSPGALGRIGAGEIVFFEPNAGVNGDGGGTPVRSTLPLDKVLALTQPGWIIEPLVAQPTPSVTASQATNPPAKASPNPGRRAAVRVTTDQRRSEDDLANFSAPSVFHSWVQLVDGQRIAGAPDQPEPGSGKNSDGQILNWSSPLLGVRPLNLDNIARIALLPADAVMRKGPTASDVVILANGDRLTGFVESLGGTVVIAPASTTAPDKLAKSSLPIGQIAEIELSNPARPLRGIAAWLNDGSLIAVPGIAIDSATRRITLEGPSPQPTPKESSSLPGESISFSTAELRAVVFAAERVLPLAAIQIAEQRAAPGRRTLYAVETRTLGTALGSDLGADDLILPGPMTVEWPLPESAVRIGGWVALEERSWAWGDCLVTLSVVPGNMIVATGRLNAQSPVIAVNADLGRLGPGARLRATVEPGEHGSIQDRVLLRRMLLQINTNN